MKVETKTLKVEDVLSICECIWQHNELGTLEVALDKYKELPEHVTISGTISNATLLYEFIINLVKAYSGDYYRTLSDVYADWYSLYLQVASKYADKVSR